MTVLIYKICDSAIWDQAMVAGAFKGAAIDLTDGYIHFSTAAQVKETATRHFARDENLVLLAIDEERLGEKLKYEPSRGGDLFPHLYGDLPISAVVWSSPLPLEADGTHKFPNLETGVTE